ncbi:acetyl esterase/lipase [Paraburkholderia bryophila]|uniref:Acetyl esterase/lipase n=2 Tax=Paraburkholderia bryophila TaxID=420952 RepID=A0A7Y9WSJ0_9BURK|nr:acetyl esterase/lipase [Paraburkholderia bryophila]
MRSYRPDDGKGLPVVLYFHGGGFTSGCLDDAAEAATQISRITPAWVVSVGYSLAPRFPFPTALEDTFIAMQWAVRNAKAWGADPGRIGVAGHDAGGNLATCLAAVVRDRAEFKISAQALLAPLLDPSLTRVAGDWDARTSDLNARQCARGYRAYLPDPVVGMHPYAAPIESRRLKGLPPAFIGSPESDFLHAESERYASQLSAAGVPTEIFHCPNASHEPVASNFHVLAEVAEFFQRWLAPRLGRRKATLLQF